MSIQEDFIEDDLATEGSDDYQLTADDFSDLFVIPSDWTVSTLRQELAAIVDLSPHFQRRSVWSQRAKSKFIESLILGIPIPQILLAERLEERNKYLVLDGKQRLTAIKEFFEGISDDGREFKLQGLDDLVELNGCSWKRISSDLPKFARSIEGAQIRTAVIRGWKRDDVLYEIFHRLNSGSVRLSPMELRMSLLRGPFVREAIRQTALCSNLQKMLGLKYPDKRMKDVEVAIRLLAFNSRALPYRGNLKEFLDGYCRFRNRDFADGASISELEVLEQAVEAGIKIFGSSNFSRKFLTQSGAYETAFNRAVFDVLGGSLCDETVRGVALASPEEFKELFESVCGNTSFLRSVEATTKSLTATKYRFTHWYSAIQKQFGVEPKYPILAEND